MKHLLLPRVFFLNDRLNCYFLFLLNVSHPRCESETLQEVILLSLQGCLLRCTSCCCRGLIISISFLKYPWKSAAHILVFEMRPRFWISVFLASIISIIYPFVVDQIITSLFGRLGRRVLLGVVIFFAIDLAIVNFNEITSLTILD